MSSLIEIKPVRSARSKARYYFNRFTQVAMLFLLGQWTVYGVLRCPFVVPYISCQNCPVITCHGRILQLFWGVWGGWIALAILFGRAFCGWACPGGLASRILAFLNPRKTEMRQDLSEQFSYGKYIVLAFLLCVFFYLGQPRADVPIRVGGFFASIGLTFEHASDLWLARTWLFLAALAAGLLVSSFWCRFFCPSGGILELFKRFSLFKVYKTKDCNNCNACLKNCYMRTRPEEHNCTNCGDCIDYCPQNCIHIGKKPK